MMWTSLSRTNQAREHLVVLVLLTFYVGIAVQQQGPIDPITNFCRRWGHQTAVVDNKLYIDGGLVTYSPSSQPPENYTNPYFIYHDLSSNASSGMPPPYANLSKNSTIPYVNGAVLWPDTVNKYIYLFGGEFYQETPWPFALYSYDIINNYWDNLGAPTSPSLGYLSYGAGLSISERGEGYYYGGWMSNNTDANWGNAPAVQTSYMLKYDMDSKSWTNTTGPDDIGRAEGVMVYIPAGDGGLIIYFGGIQDTGNGTWDGQPMDQIMIYDILSQKAYVQNATGEVPGMRRRFCAGASWPDDQSSYNIYLYGGLGEAAGSLGWDDLYVLTIPSFQWVRMYPTDGNITGQYPHHSLSCNVVNEAQMLIHGGFFPDSNTCDVPDQYGMHNVDLGEQNSDHAVWQLYDPDKTQYAVPPDVVSVVGGSSDGGATKTTPSGGFDNPDLTVLMTRKATVATRSPTRAIPTPGSGGGSGGLSTGAIAGIAVGGAVVLIAVLLGACCLIRKNRRRRRGQVESMSQPYQYHHPPQPSHSSNQYSQGPWSPQSSHFAPASPPPFQSRPQTVPPHIGPPVELPSGSTNEIPHMSPYSETASSVEPKYDAHGNVWVPQVSMMQVPSQQWQSPNPGGGGGSPLYDSTEGSNTLKPDDPSRTQSPQELGTELQRVALGPGSPTHETYYHP